MKHRIPKERQHDTTPLTAAETIKQYLIRYPRFVSDVAYIIEVRKAGRG